MKGRTRFFSNRYCGSKTLISPNFVCQRSFFYLGDASAAAGEFPVPSLPRASPPTPASPRAPTAASPPLSALRQRPPPRDLPPSSLRQELSMRFCLEDQDAP